MFEFTSLSNKTHESRCILFDFDLKSDEMQFAQGRLFGSLLKADFWEAYSSLTSGKLSQA